MSKLIQIRNVPDRVHRTLRARAGQRGQSLSAYLLAELKDIAERPSIDEIFERISHREPLEPSESTAAAVRAERDAR